MPHPNLYLFTGENTFALREELKRWKENFRQKYGDENIVVLEGGNTTIGTLLDTTATMPFIAQRRLVICEGIPPLQREELPTLLEEIHPSTLVVFVEPRLDRRLGMMKDLLSEAQVKLFEPFSTTEFRRFVVRQAAEASATIDGVALQELKRVAGEDPWTLVAEVHKLACYAPTITAASVRLLCIPSASQVVWRLTDLIGAGRGEEAMAFFREHIERGEDPYVLWTILLTMVRNIASLWVATEGGAKDERSLMQAAGVSFPAVRGLKVLVATLTCEQVEGLVEWCARADIALKTGGFRYTAEHQHEVIALAERAIVACTLERGS